jgi:type IV pilus assembly protein PilA
MHSGFPLLSRKKEIQMKRMQQGFTLIELMIVVAIVGILAAIALPAYQDYLVRSRMSEGLARGAEAKTSVAEFLSANGQFPSTVASAGFNPALGGLVRSVGCGTLCNVINIQMSSGGRLAALRSAQSAVITLSAQTTLNGLVVWRCRSTIAPRFMPASCR